nr:juvenile hormone acid O-methyltransferase-like isoform X2 [Neodiprion pinetum]
MHFYTSQNVASKRSKSHSRTMFKPALYSKINNEARRDTRDFIEEYSNEIGQMSGRCLDIGSGPCDVVTDFLLPKLNPKSTVVCSDISKPMLDYAKEKYGANDRLSFLQLDIESPTLAEDLVEQFDHVTSFYCLHWCEDMRQAFENIFELLRPGGSGFLTFVSDFPCMDAYKVLAAIPRYQRYMTELPIRRRPRTFRCGQVHSRISARRTSTREPEKIASRGRL